MASKIAELLLDNPIYMFIAAMGVLFLMLVIIGPALGFDLREFLFGVSESTRMMDAYCSETFGEGSESIGWISGDPPTISCETADGESAYVAMPEEIAEEKGIRAGTYE